MSDEDCNESSTPSSRGGSQTGEDSWGGGNDDRPPRTSARNEQGAGDGSRTLRPHELMPAHIKDKEKVDARRLIMKTAAKELGSLRQSLQGDELSSEVLCAKFMKRKTLYCCTADPEKPDRRPLRPLDILCEAKISAASPVFIKCSCTACTAGASSYTGGQFRSVGDFLQHGKEVFGPNTVVVMAEMELSWLELMDLLRLDPCDHMWYCLFCEENLPGASLRNCDACQLACHGACYTRLYGQPLAAGPDGRVLCLSCQDPALQTLQEIQAPKLPSSKAGTARYTVPLMPNEVFRRETNPSHFEKGTYDFWGPKQARLMDALVVPVECPEAKAGLAAAAAAAAAASGDQQHEKLDAAAKQTADRQGECNQATHVLLVRDPSGQIMRIDYEFGKHHKTHGENRKLWVIPLLEHLGMQLGDLLIATQEPLASSSQQQKSKQQQQQDAQWRRVLDKCDKVLQLHIIRKGKERSQQPETATSRAKAALEAAAKNAAAATVARAAVVEAGAAAAKSALPSAVHEGPAAAAAAANSTPDATAAAAGRHSNRAASDDQGDRSGEMSEAGTDEGQTLPGGTPAPAVVQAAPAGLSLFNAVATTKPCQAKHRAAAAFSAAAEAIANEVMTKPAYKIVQQQRAEQQAYKRQLEEQHRRQEQLQLQQQLLQRQLQEKLAADEAVAGQLSGAPNSDEDMSDAEIEEPIGIDPGEAGDDDYKAPAHLTRGRGRGRGRPRGSGRAGGQGSGRGRGRSKFAVEGSEADFEKERLAEGQGQKLKRKRRAKAEAPADTGNAEFAVGSEGEMLSADEQQHSKQQRKQAGGSSAAVAASHKQQQQVEDTTAAAAPQETHAVGGATVAADNLVISDEAASQQIQQLHAQLAEAQRHIATLQRQLDTAAQQRATLERARFEAIKQRDAAFAERDKSQAQWRAAQRECEEMNQQLKLKHEVGDC